MAPSALRVLPVAGLALLALSAAAARPRAGDGAARVELEVVGVVPMGEGAAAVLVLREKGARTLLPLVIPATGMGEPHGELRRPGLLGQVIEALGARISEVEIERAEESRTSARVRLTQGGRPVELRGSPSESVALAVSAKAPIVTTRRVMEEAGLTPEDLAKAHRKEAVADRLL